MKTLLKISILILLFTPIMSQAQRSTKFAKVNNKKPSRGTHRRTQNTNKKQNGSTSSLRNIEGYYNLPDSFRPSFENTPIWRIQIKVHTSDLEHSGTNSPVYVQLHSGASSIYYLENANNDLERGRTDTYDILDKKIKTIRDIQFLKFGVKGNDSWKVDKIELFVNNAPNPIYRRINTHGFEIDGNSSAPQTFTISGATLRSWVYWKHYENNRVIWLPPSKISHTVLENMVESYVGHMTHTDANMRKNHMGYGYRDGPKSVTATRKAANKMHFTLDMQTHKIVDLEVDVSFDLLIYCNNNKLAFEAQNVKGKGNIPVLTTVFNTFGLDYLNRCLGNFTLGSANVPICPTIRVNSAGDITLRP